ncbi:MAG: winged helix-turn-helix transcriptional regulator [Candidatus Thorarchaeota archaeon]|jgi:DNA-binding HxlR family transcriptional regulator
MEVLKQIKRCPVEVTLQFIGRKWTLHLIRDMFQGETRFSGFLKANPKLSTKILSLRLKELETIGLIEKSIKRKTPLLIEYHLTEKGKALGDVITELAIFSIKHNPTEVFEEIPESFEETIDEAKRRFSLQNQVPS